MQSCTFTYHRYRNNIERIFLTYPPRHKPVRLQCRNKYDGVEKLAGARRSEKGERRQLIRTVTVLKCSKFLNAFIYFFCCIWKQHLYFVNIYKDFIWIQIRYTWLLLHTRSLNTQVCENSRIWFLPSVPWYTVCSLISFSWLLLKM